MTNIDSNKKIPTIELPEGLVQSYDHEEKIMTSSFPTKWDRENFTITEEQIILKAPITRIKKVATRANNLMTWQEALNYAYSLPNNGDWEIPTIEELQTVFKIYGILGLNNKFKEAVWSSTSDPNNNAHALAIDFATGKIISRDKKDQLEVICIKR